MSLDPRWIRKQNRRFISYTINLLLNFSTTHKQFTLFRILHKNPLFSFLRFAILYGRIHSLPIRMKNKNKKKIDSMNLKTYSNGFFFCAYRKILPFFFLFHYYVRFVIALVRMKHMLCVCFCRCKFHNF